MRAVLLVLLFVFFTPELGIQGDQHAKSAAGHSTMGEYRKIYKVGYKGNYVITGEVKTKQGFFFYSVEDGHVQFIREKKYQIKGTTKKWHPFKIMINIPNTALPDNGSVVLILYERNSNGKIIHSYPVVLEQFYH